MQRQFIREPPTNDCPFFFIPHNRCSLNSYRLHLFDNSATAVQWKRSTRMGLVGTLEEYPWCGVVVCAGGFMIVSSARVEGGSVKICSVNLSCVHLVPSPSASIYSTTGCYLLLFWPIWMSVVVDTEGGNSIRVVQFFHACTFASTSTNSVGSNLLQQPELWVWIKISGLRLVLIKCALVFCMKQLSIYHGRSSMHFWY